MHKCITDCLATYSYIKKERYTFSINSVRYTCCTWNNCLLFCRKHNNYWRYHPGSFYVVNNFLPTSLKHYRINDRNKNLDKELRQRIHDFRIMFYDQSSYLFTRSFFHWTTNINRQWHLGVETNCLRHLNQLLICHVIEHGHGNDYEFMAAYQFLVAYGPLGV